MPWGTLINSEILAIHAALVPTVNGDGEIIYFGGDQHFRDFNQTNNIDAARRYNCRTGQIDTVHAPTSDVFCSGHALLADGRLLIGGGTEDFPADAGGPHHNLHFTGHRRSWIYSPWLASFAEIASMRPEPGMESADTGGGRWYPTLVTLATGEVLAIKGHPKGNDTRHNNNTPERYRPVTNSWVLLPPLGDEAAAPDLYPPPSVTQ